ncbi:MAG: hypothetical protein NVS1B7_3950 [Candidatus Saccharimonadales bacterium]
MNTATQILVIIVSATLALFLVVAITLLVYALKLVRTLQRIADHAEQIADKAEMVGEFIGKAAGPVAIGRFVTHITDNVLKHRNNSKKERK